MLRFCTRCLKVRQGNSFFDKPNVPARPTDVCKPCIYRPTRSASLGAEVIKGRAKRTRAAFTALIKRVQSNGEPLVYLVKAERDLKIGFSSNVTSRLNTLATGSASPIQLIAVVPGGRQLEQDLHTEFASLRTHGEWFRDVGNSIVKRFSTLPDAMIFLPGYLSPQPLLGVTE